MRAGRASILGASLAVLALSGCGLPRWPVQGQAISGFGVRFRGARPDVHHGIDIDARTGTPVAAMASGRVRFSGVMRGFGNVVWIDHASGYLTIYAHLSELRVDAGQRVRAGETVGLVGSTGDATTPHLHFEVWRWGRPVDPVPVLGGRPRT